MSAMRPTAPPPPSRPAERPPAAGGQVRFDRLVVGGLLLAAGVAWLADDLGVPVPWRFFPAAGLVVVGLAVTVAAMTGRGRGGLVGLGVVLLVVAAAAGLGLPRFAGPVGDRTVAPAADAWPTSASLAAGELTVDLTRHPLPPTGRLEVAVGAGRVLLLLPPAGPRVEVAVAAGQITLDGRRVDDGLQARWTEPAATPMAAGDVVVAVDVGTGDVDIQRTR